MDPTVILPYFQLVGQVALVAGAGFAGYQLYQARAERLQDNSLDILTRLQSSEFRRAYAKIWSLPLGCSAQDVIEAGPDMEEAAEIVGMTFETLGVIVHNRMVPLETVDQVIGGFLRESWRRLKPYYELRREQVGTKRIGEWYQWLAEHLTVETRRSRGAYDVFREWKQ